MNRALCISLVMIFFIKIVYAQVPVINSFSPLSGPVGTVVVINGNNFDPNPTNNIVFFGATRANVVAASLTSITVNAPVGATHHPITVMANGLTAYSALPFTVTFTGPPFSSSSLKNKVDFIVPNHSVVAKDVNNDGKADLIAANYNLYVLKNISTIGVPHFSTAFSTSNGFFTGLAVDDLNGDGKPDIVVTKYGDNKIAVFINTTINNQISYVGAGEYPTGVNPYKIAIADFNADGRPDIAVSNEGSKSVSVFSNTTPTGGAFSLLPAKDFPTQFTPRGVTAGDVDMDGNVDIMVACQSGFLSVLRNTSTINNIDFAAKIDITLPAGSSPESAVIADFDGDLKPDIATANNGSDNVSILKNSSSAANISFLARQDFATGQNNFSICTGDINGDGKPDIAVGNQADNTASVLVNTSTGNTINFNSKLDFAVGTWPRGAELADVDNDGKADLIIGNNTSGTISILINSVQKIQAVINFPAPTQPNIDANNILQTGATSNNNEVPITYTSSNPAVAYIRPDGQIQIIAPGTTIITANQAESASYLAATPVPRTYVIKQRQEIQFAPISPKLICDNDFPANATSLTPQPIFYSSSNPSVATISPAGIIHIVGAGTTTITVTQPGNNLYNDAAPQSQALTVSAPVTPTVTITANNNSVCAGSSVIFTATALNAGGSPSYQWLLNGLLTGTNSTQLTLDNILATDVIQCRVTSGGNCSTSGSSNTLSIVVQPMITPSVTIQVIGGPFCAGSPVVFTATPTNEGANPAYQWRVNNLLLGTTLLPTYSYSGFNNGDRVTCVLSNNSLPCLTSATATSNEIVVSIATAVDPQVSVTASANSVYGGTPVTFTATAQVSVAVYQWQINNKNYGTNAPTFTTNALKNGDNVTCIVTATDACAVPVVSDAVIMEVLQPPDINIPNAFTPNGDGINDTWQITQLNFYPDCIVKIFNRSGTLIYQSKGYANAWDGTFNGKKLPAGTYYFIIDTRAAGNSHRSGYVSILR